MSRRQTRLPVVRLSATTTPSLPTVKSRLPTMIGGNSSRTSNWRLHSGLNGGRTDGSVGR